MAAKNNHPMVNLPQLLDYFRQIPCHAVLRQLREDVGPEIRHFEVDTVDADVGKKFQGLTRDNLPVLGLILPTAVSTSDDVDAVTERTTVVITVLDKFDPQRHGRDAVRVCIDTQPLIEAIKTAMINDKAAGCTLMSRLDLRSLSTMPETAVYGTLAGWSLGFSFETVDCPPGL